MASMGLMECVNGNDQFCGDQAEVEWTTEPGVRYYIVVHGHLTSSGNFELLILPSSPFDDDAISMVGPGVQIIDGVQVIGEGVGATVSGSFPISELP
jgi:hypothetical protein